MGESRIIGHMNRHIVAFHDVDQRPGYLSVEGEYFVAETRSHIDSDFIYGQVEFPLRTPTQGRQH